MELYQLKTFVMVAGEEHLTRAARRLHASQPTVSGHIKALEDELGVNLFLRTPKGMILTQDGRALQAHAEQVLEAATGMARAAELMRGSVRGDLRIGINTEPESLYIPELFDEMARNHSQVTMHILQAMSAEVPERLEKGVLDCAFVYGPVVSDRLFAVELARFRVVVAGPGRWREKMSKSGAAGLGELPWIMTPDDCPFHQLAENFFKTNNIQPQQVALVDKETVIRTMIQAGAGLSMMLERDLLQRASAEDEASGLTVWAEQEMYLPLSIVCLQSRKAEVLQQTLFATMTRIFHERS
ncbi:LysR family transcriptional regulator [Desulfosediminicola sp.]|uniref:LysR family transcriptional regulator n=1 Tax=Desulfosediminicola sp. TaxID=2886825 RepID=UPI003AF22A23